MMTESMYVSRRAGGSPVTGGQRFTATEYLADGENVSR